MAGTEVLNGTQLPLDMASILSMLTGQKLEARGQDMSWNDRLLTYYERERDAQQQYGRDVASIGLDQANLNFQQRQADASNELQRQQGVLGRDTLNANQRSDLASKKLGIVDMLTSRRGPSNWVKYNSLLNGLDAPTAERSATIDPFKLLEGMVRESEAFSAPIASVNRPASVSLGGAPSSSGIPSWLLEPLKPLGTSNMGGGGGGGGGGSLLGQSGPSSNIFGNTAWGSPGYATNRPPTSVSGLQPEDVFSGIRNEDVSYLKPGMSGLHVTGTGGPSRGGDYQGFKVADPSTGKVYGADDQIQGGTNVWITRLADGGMIMGGGQPAMALTGDGRGKEPSKNSELAMALPGAGGQPVLKVFSPEETRALMERVRGKAMPRAASGGTYGTGNTDPVVQLDQYAPKDLGNQPFIRKLFGGRGGAAFGGFGAKLSNPSIGIDGAPTLLNLQAFNKLMPSEQDATNELYGTGLEVDFRDLLESARRAAPAGRTFGPAGYGF